MKTISEEIYNSKRKSKRRSLASWILILISLIIGVFTAFYNLQLKEERQEDIDELIEQMEKSNQVINSEQKQIDNVIQKLDSTIINNSTNENSSDSLRREYKDLQKRIDSLNKHIIEIKRMDLEKLQEIKRKN